MKSEEELAGDLATATASLRGDSGCCPDASFASSGQIVNIPSPEEMSASVSQALEEEFLENSAHVSGGSDQLFATLMQMLDQNPGLKITLSK